MKKYVLPLVLAVPLALVACGREDGFRDEEQKEVVWEAKKCSAYGSLTAAGELIDIQLDLIADNIHTDEVAEAKRWSRRLERADIVADAMEYQDIEGASDMCTGWLWEREKQSDGYWDGYEEYTAEQAIEDGVAR